MKNATYVEGDNFIPTPRPERIASFGTPGPLELNIGLKTLTHNRSGMRINPHKVIVIEIKDGTNVLSFDIDAIIADAISARLRQFAAILDLE